MSELNKLLTVILHDEITTFMPELMSRYSPGKKIVVCTGDSFTNGSGLGDHIIKGWPGYDNDETLSRDKWLAISRKAQDDNDALYKRVFNLERTNSWANQLQLLDDNLIVVNDSAPGSSNDRSIRRATEWMLLIKEVFPSADVTLIVGLSEIQRFEMWDLEIKNWVTCHPGWFFSKEFLKAHPGHWAEKLLPYWLSHLDDMLHWVHRSAFNLLALDGMASKLDVKLHTFHWLHGGYHAKIMELNNEKQVSYLIRNLGMLWYINHMHTPSIGKVQNSFCPCGHYSPDVHKHFAADILTKINTQ